MDGAWMVWVDAGLTLVSLAVYALFERWWARWIPWWRRGLYCLPLALKAGVGAAELASVEGFGPRTRIILSVVAVGIWQWNFWTALRNRRDGNDQWKLEASRSERLTEVQQAAFRRQAMEAA
jgi:hypothetical protein